MRVSGWPFFAEPRAARTQEDRRREHAAGDDGSFALVYLPTGQPAAVHLDRLAGESINACWFNPQQNSSQLIGSFKRTPQRTFTPPSAGRNNDWVLVIYDADRDLPQLGDSYQNIVPVVKK